MSSGFPPTSTQIDANYRLPNTFRQNKVVSRAKTKKLHATKKISAQNLRQRKRQSKHINSICLFALCLVIRNLAEKLPSFHSDCSITHAGSKSAGMVLKLSGYISSKCLREASLAGVPEFN